MPESSSGVPAFGQIPPPPAPGTTAFEIPTSPIAASSFSISLNGTIVQLTLSWCDPAQIWTLEIDDSDGNRILCGVPLVTGADLLAQYPYLDFGGVLIAQSDHDAQTPPSLASLGITGHLYFVTPNNS